MKFFGKTSTLVASCLTLVFAAGCIWLNMKYNREQEKTRELQEQLATLSKKEMRSAVMQSINAQMEEIALQERRISEEQREAAEEQTKVAEEMRQHAEKEQEKSLEAQHQAQSAEETANKQRIIAENLRAKAELSKRVADTLSYQTLARQLGNVAITQYRAGNKELAELLAYTAYTFTERYHGDIYFPTIYEALVLTSQSKRQWNRHKGAVTDVYFYTENEYSFLTCTSYGELFSHQLTGTRLKTDTIYFNKNLDFRNLYYEKNTKVIYAVSRTGQILIHQKNKNTLCSIDGIGPLIRMESVGNDLIVIGENGLSILDTKTFQITHKKTLPYKIVFVCQHESVPLMFDNQGKMHYLRGFDKIESKKVPFKGQVTAFACSNSRGIKAYGMSDGTIHYIDAKGKTQKFVGHRSRISKIKINGWRIYSSSYDGKMNLWMADNEKIEPMTIIETNGWIIDFTFDSQKSNILCGDHRGTITEAIISVPVMTKKLKSILKRDFTHEEWNYYIGRNVPYEKLTGKEAGK